MHRSGRRTFRATILIARWIKPGNITLFQFSLFRGYIDAAYRRIRLGVKTIYLRHRKEKEVMEVRERIAILIKSVFMSHVGLASLKGNPLECCRTTGEHIYLYLMNSDFCQELENFFEGYHYRRRG
jgi:hypothetical protein